MKSGRTSLRHLSLTFAVTLALTCQASAMAAGAQPDPAPTADEISKTVTEYQTAADAEWTTSAASAAATTSTASVQTTQNVRDSLANEGLAVTSAKSDVSIVDSATQADGTVLVTADVSTTFTFEGDDTPGIWSDRHQMTLSSSASGYTVVSDTIDNKVSEDSEDSEELNETPFMQSSDDKSTAGSEESEADGEQPAEGQAQPRPNAGNMVKYALKWTSPPYDGDSKSDFNPEFPYKNNNCANFVSQVLHAGGWDYDQGYNPYDTAVWAPDLIGPAGPSRTWTRARAQRTYVEAHTPYRWLRNIWDAQPGDLLYPDWDSPNQAGKPDGKVDHVMVVTGRTNNPQNPLVNGPRISQKSPNRSNIPLMMSIIMATGQGKEIHWTAFKR